MLVLSWSGLVAARRGLVLFVLRIWLACEGGRIFVVEDESFLK
jgi:hypothetical protein